MAEVSLTGRTLQSHMAEAESKRKIKRRGHLGQLLYVKLYLKIFLLEDGWKIISGAYTAFSVLGQGNTEFKW